MVMPVIVTTNEMFRCHLQLIGQIQANGRLSEATSFVVGCWRTTQEGANA